MPVREICQTEKLIAADLPSLCLGCCRRPDCETARAFTALLEPRDPTRHVLAIVSECADFLPTKIAADRGIGRSGLREPLRAAGIAPLCEGCASSEGCDTKDRLDLAVRLSYKMGAGIVPTVVTCKSTGGELHQIREPRT